MAVAPEQQGQGLGRALLEAAEAALDQGTAVMRLEVHPLNFAAIALYRRAGYLEFGVYRGFYEDDSDALRMQYALVPRLQPDVPACRTIARPWNSPGPAALMMAMKALNRPPAGSPARAQSVARVDHHLHDLGPRRLQPHGMALAAWRRGFAVELFVNDEGPPFLDTVRTPDKKGDAAGPPGVPRRDPAHGHHRAPAPLVGGRAEHAVAAGAIPVVLISQYRIYGDKEPHWIIVSGCDQRFIYAHDPYISEAHVTTTDREHTDPASRIRADGALWPIQTASGDHREQAGRRPLMLIVLSEQPPSAFPEALAELVWLPRIYITRPERFRARSVRLINLSRDCEYLGTGYYASLLAEARGHKVIPSVQTILDLGRRALYRFALPELNAILAKSLSKLSEPVREPVSLLIAFGNTADGRFRSFTRAVFDKFRHPLLRR